MDERHDWVTYIAPAPRGGYEVGRTDLAKPGRPRLGAVALVPTTPELHEAILANLDGPALEEARTGAPRAKMLFDEAIELARESLQK